jgi:hypothetical protein
MYARYDGLLWAENRRDDTRRLVGTMPERSVLAKNLVESHDAWNNQSDESYSVYGLTGAGLSWLLSNKDRLTLRAGSADLRSRGPRHLIRWSQPRRGILASCRGPVADRYFLVSACSKAHSQLDDADFTLLALARRQASRATRSASHRPNRV